MIPRTGGDMLVHGVLARVMETIKPAAYWQIPAHFVYSGLCASIFAATVLIEGYLAA
jgi:hypothetical protein